MNEVEVVRHSTRCLSLKTLEVVDGYRNSHESTHIETSLASTLISASICHINIFTVCIRTLVVKCARREGGLNDAPKYWYVRPQRYVPERWRANMFVRVLLLGLRGRETWRSDLDITVLVVHFETCK